MAATETVRPSAARTRFASAVRWLDMHTLWAMNPADTMAARERLLTQQWTRSSDPDAVARETAR